MAHGKVTLVLQDEIDVQDAIKQPIALLRNTDWCFWRCWWWLLMEYPGAPALQNTHLPIVLYSSIRDNLDEIKLEEQGNWIKERPDWNGILFKKERSLSLVIVRLKPPLEDSHLAWSESFVTTTKRSLV